MIKKVINRFSAIVTRLDVHTREVVTKSLSSTIVKLIGIAVGIGVSVFLGRTIGAEGLGIINLSHRIINILLVIGVLGMQQVIIKEIAISQSKKDYAHIGNVMYSAYWLNGGITLVLSVIFILISPWLSNHVFNEPRLTYPLMVALVVMTPQVFSRIFSSALIGFKKIWQSNLVDQTLSVSFTGLLLLVIWLMKYEITINLIATCFAIGRLVVTISMIFYWQHLFSSSLKRRIIIPNLVKSSLPVFIITGSMVIATSADAIIVGWLRDSKDVGLYTVAARIALLSSFFLQVTNAAIAPKIASLYNSKKKDELEKMIQRVTGGLFFIGIISLVLFIILGPWILGIWGYEFRNAHWILVILGFGQFINLGTGAVGILLIMANRERLHAKISVTFMLLNVILNIILIYYWGIYGAAIATAFTVTLDNITKMIYAKKRLDILSFPILRSQPKH